MALRDYIAHQLKEIHTKNKIDFMEEADAIIAKMLDPNWSPPVAPTKKNFTKVNSYNQFMSEYTSKTYQTIFKILQLADEPLSRADIANDGQLRLATVCGRVAELIEAGAIRVVGTKIDMKTKRPVEILLANFGDKSE
jgi:hypothetical protein